MATYSIAFGFGSTLVFGAANERDGLRAFVKSTALPDANLSGNVCTTQGGMHNTMSDGDLMLCRRPDGSIFVGEFDSELSRTANPVIRKKYG